VPAWPNTTSPDAPLDFEQTVEDTLLALHQRFNLQEARYDPYQMQASAQRLAKEGVNIVEFPQSVPNLTEASQNLYELIKGTNLQVYPDAAARLAISRAVAVEGSRGWKIAKEKQSHKIDFVVALAMASLAAVKAQQGSYNWRVHVPGHDWINGSDEDEAQAAQAHAERVRRIKEVLLAGGEFPF
jgi:phage terminase large subunit-like protein